MWLYERPALSRHPSQPPVPGFKPEWRGLAVPENRSSPRLRRLCSIKSLFKDACGLGQVFRRTPAGNLFSYAPACPMESSAIFTPGAIVELMEIFFRYVP